VAQSHQ